MDAALLLFAKVPRPGHVKTRLTPALSPSEAARLYTAFLRDTVRQSRQLSAVDVRLYLAPPLPDGGLDALPSDVSLHKQDGDGLGARMRRAFRDTLEDGYQRVVLMGSDHPTLPRSFLQQAYDALDAPESVCIGPTEDGGFYLLGMSAFYPHLFADMTYSHSEVLSDTLTRGAQTDARLVVLPQWYDVDRPPDLNRMLNDLKADTAEAPNTRRISDHLDLRSRLPAH
ncbi:MAG: TIGR04282 family arsenosugar biosynthesis glycosyltransferase [Salinibacter sp.]